MIAPGELAMARGDVDSNAGRQIVAAVTRFAASLDWPDRILEGWAGLACERPS